MRRRKLKRLWKRLQQLACMTQSPEDVLMRLGAARKDTGRVWQLVDVQTAPFRFSLYKARLRQTRTREGRYPLRSNLQSHDPAVLWTPVHPAHGDRTGVQGAQAGSQPTAGLTPGRSAH